MQYLISYSLLFIIFLICRLIFINLKSRFYKKHQKFAGRESVPLIGGIVIFSFICLNFEYFDGYILFFSFLVLCLGISSDCDFINSPKIRLILQSSLIIIFVDMLNLNILDLRNEFLNNLISNYYLNVFFITFCFLVLINGSNFIDGLDGLNLGYFLSLLIIILTLSQSSKLIINVNQIMILFYIITFLFLLNIFNYLYLGDSGSYLIGFSIGALLIVIYKEIPFFSPFFVVLLLWYPCFENLFSILRKYKFNLSPLRADNKHLHHLLFFFIKSKFKLTELTANNFASIFINFVNLIFFILGINFIYNSLILIIIILSLVLIYMISYLFLFNYRYRKN